jgi:cytochrome bd-type quinol oxidase subunit 2
MALTNPAWPYWYTAFWAQALSPLSVDVLVTVGMLIVSEVFEEERQGTAGAVFNTVGLFGLSLGVGVCQVVALGVGGEAAGNGEEEQGEEASLLKGYRAGFWTMFGFMVLCTGVALAGLRGVGRVGLKRE